MIIYNFEALVTVLETICDLRKSQPEISSSCDDNMRVVAFNFVKISGILTLYKSVIEAFELDKAKDILVLKVQELVAEQYYKDVSSIMKYVYFKEIIS